VKNLKPNFSHIYVEKDVVGYPLTDLALSKFSSSSIVMIDHYKDLFNRPGQDFQVQKLSMKLILAKKKEPYLYPASNIIQDYDTPNVFYNTPILNCIYNCDYCYLQGMYNSGNLVVFVNEDDMMDAIDREVSDPRDPSRPTVVSISYNTDLLAMENILPLSRRWINYIDGKRDTILEIRTKSALFGAIKDIEPSENVILSWTLSPEPICAKYESTAPPLKSRVNAIKSALDSGWQVRLCFDPIILIDDWFEIYSLFLKRLFQEINGSHLRDVTLGVFRMNKDYFNRIRKRETRSDIYFSDYAIENGIVVVDGEKRRSSMETLVNILTEFVPKDKILVWKK
jgi:spore photoproduct lyase